MPPPGIEIVTIPRIRSKREYSVFLVKHVPAHVQTSHMLVMQWDGYVTRPEAWDPAFLDVAYNAALIPVAAGVLYPAFGILLSPVLAAGAMALCDRVVLFNDDKWHCVEAMFQLNSLNLQADKPNADGIVRGWFDGKLVIERTDVTLRSTDFPGMQFNQYLLTPYFGPGLLPHSQTLWIDELAVATGRISEALKQSE